MKGKLNAEKVTPNWVLPDFEYEAGEISRVISDFLNLELTEENVSKINRTIQQGHVIELDEEIWARLDNTDSYENVELGKIEQVYEIIELSNKELDPKYHRDVKTIFDGMINKSPMQMPIIIQNKENLYHLVSGNKRLMVCRALKINPKVICAKVKHD